MLSGRRNHIRLIKCSVTPYPNIGFQINNVTAFVWPVLPAVGLALRLLSNNHSSDWMTSSDWTKIVYKKQTPIYICLFNLVNWVWKSVRSRKPVWWDYWKGINPAQPWCYVPTWMLFPFRKKLIYLTNRFMMGRCMLAGMMAILPCCWSVQKFFPNTRRLPSTATAEIWKACQEYM